MTKRQLEILVLMRDHAGTDDGELVYEKGMGYLGLTRVSRRTVFALLAFAAVHANQFSNVSNSGLERYTINETGLNILKAYGL